MTNDEAQEKINPIENGGQIMKYFVDALWFNYPVTVLSATPDLGHCTIVKANDKAYDLFRLDRRKKLEHTPEKVIGALKDWMDEADYEALNGDQACLRKALLDSQGPWGFSANVPVKLNNSHPKPEFRNKSFWPVMIGYFNEQDGDNKKEYMMVIYIESSKYYSTQSDS